MAAPILTLPRAMVFNANDVLLEIVSGVPST